MERNKRKKRLLGTPIQTKLLILIFASATIPTAITVGVLYYLILSLLDWQLGASVAFSAHLIFIAKQIHFIFFMTLPLFFLLLWLVSLELSNRIAGPLYRLERELDARISGAAHGEIRLRAKDELRELVKKINKLIEKNNR